MDTSRTAQLIPGSGGRVLPCTVLDLSLTGARLETREPVDANRKFSLHLEGSGENHRCHVVWQKENQIGVAFE